MNRHGWLLTGLGTALLLLAAASGCKSVRGSTPPTDEILAATRELERRFAAGDLLGVADLYADDAVLLTPGSRPVRGRTEIDAYWTNIVDPVDWKIEIRSIEGQRDLVVQRGRSRMRTRHEGVVQTSEVEFAFLWRRQPDGVLRIALDAFWPR